MDLALIAIATGLVSAYYGLLGVNSGRRFDYVRTPFHDAVSSTSNRVFRLARTQNWLTYRFRRWLLGAGLALICIGALVAMLAS